MSAARRWPATPRGAMTPIVSALCVVVSALVATPSADARAAWSGRSSMIGGTVAYDAGEWIWQDFVYDDHGADTQAYGAPQRVTLGPTSGDFRYPTHERYAGNAADVAEVRVRAVGDDLDLRVTMNTLVDADAFVLGVAMTFGDADARAPKPWPHEAGVRSPWDAFATIAEGEARLDGGERAPVVVDEEANTVDVTLPDVAGSARDAGGLTLTVGAGLWDTTADTWLAGVSGNSATEAAYSTGGTTGVRVFDLAFNATEPRRANWMEDVQSDVLAAGDVSSAGTEVGFDAGDVGLRPIPSGFVNLVFRSRMTHLPEGVRGTFPGYNGLYQTYALWVPAAYDPSTRAPLVLLLHSLSTNHNQYADYSFYEQIGDELGALMVTPLARGPDGWYWDEALVDTLEVWRDVRERFNVDEDRTYVAGYSMGGYGTYRLGTMMPDRFASAVSWVGPPAYQFWAYPLEPTPSGARRGPGNTYHQLENVEHVPFFIVQGTNDELVPVTGVTHQAERLHELGFTYRYNVHPGQDHFSVILLDDWSREAAWFERHPRRAEDPAHVRFEVRPGSWVTPGRDEAVSAEILGHLRALGADADSAYWVRDVVVAGEGDVTGVVDLTTAGRPGRDVTTTEVVSVEPFGSTPHLRRGVDRLLSDGDPTANALWGRLEGVAELTVDVRRAGLSLGEPIVLSVDVDRVVTLRLVDGDRTEAVSLEP